MNNDTKINVPHKDPSIAVFLVLNTLVFFLRIFSHPIITYIALFFEAIAIFAYVKHLFQSAKSKKSLLVETVVLAIAGFTYILSGYKYEYLLLTYLTVFAIKGVDYSYAVKYMFYTQLLCMGSVLLLSTLGIIPDVVSTKHTVSGYYFTIHSLGFGHGNTFYCLYFNLIAMYLYLYRKRIKLTSIVFLTVLSTLFYYLTASRTGFICTIILLFGFCIIKKYPSLIKKLLNLKLLKLLLITLEPLLFIFVYLCSTKFFGSDISNFVNRIVTNRINVANYYIKTFGVHILPQSFNMGVEFDNLYAFSLVSFGWIYNIFISYLYIKLMLKLYKKNNALEMLIISVFLLYGFSERIIINIFRNMSLIFYSDLLKESDKK